MGQEVSIALTIGEILALLSAIGGAIFGILKLLIATKLNEIHQTQEGLSDQIAELTESIAHLQNSYHKVDKEIAVQIAKWERNS